jgi:hypothetical protein
MKDIILKLEPIIAAGGALAFVVVYLLYSKWWKSSMGRHMMAFMSSMFILLFFAILIRFFPAIGTWSFKAACWGLVIFIMWWRAWVAFSILVLKRYEKVTENE